MDGNAAHDPIRCQTVGFFVDDVDSKALHRLKAAFEKSDGMFRANAEDGYMVVVFGVDRDVTERFLERGDNPNLDLSSQSEREMADL